MNKKISLKTIILASVAIIILGLLITATIFYGSKQNEYIYLDSASLDTCNAKQSTLQLQGWTCYGCKDSDGNGKFSLFCDPPTCQTPCTLGATDCSGTHYFKCSSTGSCSTYWSDQGIIKGKCNVECKIDSDCGSGNTCSNYKCIISQQQCTPNTRQDCYNNNVWSYDSCGKLGTMFQECISPKVCQNAVCITPQTDLCQANNVQCSESCSGTTLLYNGVCQPATGQCSYVSDTASAKCNSVNTNTQISSEFIVIMVIILLLIISILVGYLIVKAKAKKVK